MSNHTPELSTEDTLGTFAVLKAFIVFADEMKPFIDGACDPEIHVERAKEILTDNSPGWNNPETYESF